jgi:thiamine pyrophosphokinase
VHFDSPTIAAEGVLNLLLRKAIAADIIIGDWDRTKRAFAEKIKTSVMPDQSSSAFQKALGVVREDGLSPSIMLGTENVPWTICRRT